MYEQILANSLAFLENLDEEKKFLIGNIFYLAQALRGTNSDPEIIEGACQEIEAYLSEVLQCVISEWEIMDSIIKYLYAISNDISLFRGFETSPECELFKGILELFERTYPKRANEYLWYIREYKKYADTNRIAKSYKIISKQKHLSKEKYDNLLNTIPTI